MRVGAMANGVERERVREKKVSERKTGNGREIGRFGGGKWVVGAGGREQTRRAGAEEVWKARRVSARKKGKGKTQDWDE